MSDQKPWYLSKTIWDAGISVAATLGAMAGVSVDQSAQSALTEAILQA
jgi:hypothetical protein